VQAFITHLPGGNGHIFTESPQIDRVISAAGF
jgi:hypothetical protein